MRFLTSSAGWRPLPSKAGDPRHQGLDMGTEQAARVQVGEQVLHGQQGMDFLGGKPQAR
jgi:hypothetical protein